MPISSNIQSLALKYARYTLLGLRATARFVFRVAGFLGSLLGAVIRIVFGFTLIPLYQLYHAFKSSLLSGVSVRVRATTFKHVFTHTSNVLAMTLTWIGVAVLAFAATTSASEPSSTLLFESLNGETGEITIEQHSSQDTAEEYVLFDAQPDALVFVDDAQFDSYGIDDDGAFQTEPFNSVFEAPRTRTGTETYIVKDGDTLSGIAARFGLNVNTILWANNLTQYSVIRPNASLTILPTDGVLYTVAKGDTISKIAKRYGISEESIIAFNTNGDTIVPGTNIVLPDAKPLRVLVQTPSRSSTSNIPAGAFTPKRSSGSGFTWPTPGRRINQYFSWRHNGLDIDNNTADDPIYAAESGTIIKAGWNNGGYGNRVLIQHSGGQQTNYGHLKKVFVKAGEKVQKGDVIGIMGTTGRSTGVHLHFEIIINGRRVNPLSYLQ